MICWQWQMIFSRKSRVFSKNIRGDIPGNANLQSHISMNLSRCKNLKIDFNALSFIAPEDILFKYKLHGFDPQWQNAGNKRSAVYKSLPSGSYKFQVIACNSDGIWNNTGACFNFTIIPKFYQTTIFKAGLVLMICLIIYSLYWMVQNKQLITHFFYRKYKDSTLSKEDSKKYLQKNLSCSPCSKFLRISHIHRWKSGYIHLWCKSDSISGQK